MNKNEFIKELTLKLEKRLTKEESLDAITYYEELINDRLDLGENEYEIVESLDSIDHIVKVISIENIEKRPRTKDVKSLYSTFISLIKLATSPFLVVVAIVFAIVMFSLTVSLGSTVIGFIVSLVAIIISAVDSVNLVVTSGGGLLLGIFTVGLHIFIFGIFLAIIILIKDLLYFLINKSITFFTLIFKKRVV